MNALRAGLSVSLLSLALACSGVAIDPAALAFLSTTSIGPGAAYGVAGGNGIAYANDAYGSSLVRVNKGTDPMFVSTIESSPHLWVASRAIVLQGTTLFRGHNNLFEVLDVSTPAAPAIVATESRPGMVMDIALVGNVAYVADDFMGVMAFDVSDPANPAALGQVIAQPAYAVAADAQHVYVANQTQFFVVEIQSPSTYQTVATRTYGARDLLVHGHTVYASVNSTAEAIDVTDPANPTATYTTGGGVPSGGFALMGNYLFLAGSGGWLGYDVSAPGAPSQKWSDGVLTTSGATDVAVADRFLLLAGPSGVSIFGPQ